jgi:hypothetical protein
MKICPKCGSTNVRALGLGMGRKAPDPNNWVCEDCSYKLGFIEVSADKVEEEQKKIKKKLHE